MKNRTSAEIAVSANPARTDQQQVMVREFYEAHDRAAATGAPTLNGEKPDPETGKRGLAMPMQDKPLFWAQLGKTFNVGTEGLAL